MSSQERLEDLAKTLGLNSAEAAEDAIDAHFKCFSSEEIFVLTAWYGLHGNRPRTLTQIGERLTPPLSQKQVGDIKNQVVERLRTLMHKPKKGE